ncbi:hypothetical protein EVG20_g2653 [Dentipellis fragilis]|uniref:HMG box domain-containing protein n=1 Tax=Dentipellis fragilis TaxID=205917 RepID=A0A4Y9Z890_9AGAM|nr:hypothetical protein EVG20_g2653 [Dentipellis fragilis]
MPALRSSRRRKSSLAILAAGKPIKAGKYGVVHNNTTTAPAPRTVTFAPNVTPTTYAESGDSIRTEPADLQSQLFPQTDESGQSSKKRLPPGKRPSQGYIPRPPNAFMLFRAAFVRQKHVPGSIETNYGSLSKIVGNCWRSLPLEEKRVWEIKAKAAKAEHKAAHPDYRFKPVHRTAKEKRVKHPALAEEEQRCEDVAQLLLEGKRGEELTAAVKMLERLRSSTPSTLPRRSSSVPLPGTSFPGTVPDFSNTDNFFGAGPSQPHSPVIPELYLPRRPSSARAAMNRSWTEPFNYVPSDSPLPDVNFSLFEQSYLDGPFSAGQQDVPFSFDSMFPSMPANNGSPLSLEISPLDNIAPTDMSIPPDAFAPSTASTMSYPSTGLAPTNPFFWTGSSDGSSAGLNSDPSSIYSGSPAPSELSLPLHAPQPPAYVH